MNTQATDHTTQFITQFMQTITDDLAFGNECIRLVCAKFLLQEATRSKTSIVKLGVMRYMDAERFLSLEEDLLRLLVIQKYNLAQNLLHLDRAHTLQTLMEELLAEMHNSGMTQYILLNKGHGD